MAQTDITEPSNPPERTFQPNRTLYIAPHRYHGPKIQLYDLAGRLNAAYPSDEWVEEAKQLGELAEQPAIFTVIQERWFKPSTVHTGDVDEPSETTTIATWKRGHGTNHKFKFPEGSVHCSHELTTRATRPKAVESFVLNSAELYWKRVDGRASRGMILWKKLGGKEIQVGQFYGTGRSTKPGGVIVVDEREVDVLVAFLVACCLLKRSQEM